MATKSKPKKTPKSNTTRVLFNTTTHIKEAAQKRAYREGTDLTTVLNQTMVLYAEKNFDPDDFITKEVMASLRRARADVKAGRVYTLDEVRAHLGLA